MEKPSLADFRSLRNWIIQEAYDRTPLTPLWCELLRASGFVLSVRIGLLSSDALVFQFVSATLSTYFILVLLEKLPSNARVNVTRLSHSITSANIPSLSLITMAELFRLRSLRNQDFPLQRSTLLVLILIAVQHLGPWHETDPRWIGAEIVMAVLYLALRRAEEFRDETHQWLAAASAIHKYLSAATALTMS